MATSALRAQEAIRAHGSSKCSKHYGKEVIYVCETCDVLACVDCAVQQHKGHELESLSNIVPEAKQKLKDFITRAEGTEIPHIEEKLKKLNSNLSKARTEFQEQVSQIKQRNEIIKNELDKIADTMVKSCQDMEHQTLDTLLDHQKELQTQLDKLSSKIKEVKATLQSANDILVYDTSHVIPSEFEDLPTPFCSTAAFSTGELRLQEIEDMFGTIHTIDMNWSVISEFAPFDYKMHNVMLMHAAGNTAWLSDTTETLSLVNQKGQVQQTLDMEVTDFCLSPKTGKIWFFNDVDNSVREVRNKTASVKFTVDKEPKSICVTKDDHILLGSYRQIEKYTQTGESVCTTLGGTPPVVRGPHRMSECPLTGHIAVMDLDFSNHGGNDEPFVCILNDQLQLLHTYKGEVSGQQPPPEPFAPQDVCYTETGELIINTWNEKSVVLVTGKGKYLKTLYKYKDRECGPIAVSQHSGTLWVSFSDRYVKVLQNN